MDVSDPSATPSAVTTPLRCHLVMLSLLLLMSRSPQLCPRPHNARSATGCKDLGPAVVLLASSRYVCTCWTAKAIQGLTAEPTLCMAAICASLYPVTHFQSL